MSEDTEMAKKKRVMVISTEYLPLSNGTITCLNNILTYLSDEWNVTVFSANKSLNCKKTETVGNIEIIRFGTKSDRLVCIKEKLVQEATTRLYRHSLIRKLVIFFVKFLFYFPTQISKVSGFYYDRRFLLHAYPHLKREMERFDIILTVGAPFENVKLGYRLKQEYPQKKWILILFDLYTYYPFLSDEEEIRKRLAEETLWYQEADYVVVQPEIKERIRNTPLGVFYDKLQGKPIPSLKEIECNIKKTILQNGKTNIVYTGRFYEDIRNPEYMLRLFQRACELNPSIQVHIAGFGCENLIEKYKAVMKDHLQFYGYLAKDKTDELMRSADILLNVSNAVSTQTPSKILEYIGTCKPIINIYSIQEDVCEKYLQNYPLKCGISEKTEVEEQVQRMLKFIDENHMKLCSAQSVENSYIDFTAKKFSDDLLNCAFEME